jgi:lysozyme
VNDHIDPYYYIIIKEFEKFIPKAYWDASGRVWTIGWGSTKYEDGRPIQDGDIITREYADFLLADYVKKDLLFINTLGNLNKNQKAALLALSYNIGLPALKRSSVTKSVREGDFKYAASRFGRFRLSGGKILRGLVIRREVESRVFLSSFFDHDEDTIRDLRSRVEIIFRS